ncbi:DUF4352 domain-containing protein [Halobacillus sp. H74]|uniref:DUF4352 domain-containing protein n=1 Tax=Halobacillus sp. H74 TaxID=3457436 RepID=UPI003FCCF10B
MKKLFKWGLIVIVGLVVLSFIFGDEDDSATKVDNNESTEASAEGEKEEAPAEDKVFSVGDEVQLGDILVTIDSAKYTEAAEYTESKNGKIITLDATIKNNGSEEIYADATEFTMATPDGNMAEGYFGYNELELSGEIRDGKQLKGKLYFDVPEAEYYELYYEPTFSWSGDEIEWKIEKSELQ